MVLKPLEKSQPRLSMFESSVNSDGTQTLVRVIGGTHLFESSVNSDGTQTIKIR